MQDKTTVIQEARVFNESPISPRKCRILLTKIVYLLYVGETFGAQEATTLFFGVTKLFQHKDVSSHHIALSLHSSLTTFMHIPNPECLATDGLLGHQRALPPSSGRHHGHLFNYEGHAA